MLKITARLLALFLASPVYALSCLPPDSVRLYEQVREDAADYFIVRGRLEFSEPVNTPGRDGAPKETVTEAEIVGVALSSSGFNVPFDRPVSVRGVCLSIWCGDLASLEEETYFFALQSDGDALSLRRGPCGGHAVSWDQDSEDRLLACHLGDKCEPR